MSWRLVREEAEHVAQRKMAIYFHTEPFDSANDITGEGVEMNDDAVSAAYDQTWPTTTGATRSPPPGTLRPARCAPGHDLTPPRC